MRLPSFLSLAPFAFVFTCALALAPTAARSCENEVLRTIDEATRGLAEAEKNLEKCRADEVYDYLSETVLGYAKDRESVKSDGPRAPLSPADERRAALLRPRMARMLAVAGMRAHAKITPAIAELRQLLKAKPDDVWLKARLAEALGRKKRWPEALALLAELEQNDLLPDPEAWATLAAGREASGDTATAERARERCGKIASLPGRCVFPPVNRCPVSAQR